MGLRHYAPPLTPPIAPPLSPPRWTLSFESHDCYVRGGGASDLENFSLYQSLT
ncbi:ORF49 [Fowl aviadenovirus C]|uniref:ORF49 n=1 Tax=Fowl aviadenovirus C TaxID=190063 RepID=A0A5J6RF87_9ADEN|nr:ORF49 [Fowl aviadenovirus C]